MVLFTRRGFAQRPWSARIYPCAAFTRDLRIRMMEPLCALQRGLEVMHRTGIGSGHDRLVAHVERRQYCPEPRL